MNTAMAKLNSILNPNKQSPEELKELQSRADGVLKRIKDQLHEAAMGTTHDGEDEDDDDHHHQNGNGRYESRLHEDEVTSHQKLALRGREIIFKLSNHKPVRIRRSGDSDNEDGSEYGGDDDDDDEEEVKKYSEGEDDKEEGGNRHHKLKFKQHQKLDNDEGGNQESKTNNIFGGSSNVSSSISMTWQGPITVDRLTDDAEEMANSRGLKREIQFFFDQTHTCYF
jgi:hypothetical protein